MFSAVCRLCRGVPEIAGAGGAVVLCLGRCLGGAPRGRRSRPKVRLCGGAWQYLEEACQGSLARGEPRLKESSFN